MTDDINNNLEPLADDELNEVAGGTNANDVKALAEADGRIYQVAATNFRVGGCICAAHNKWAKFVDKTENGNIFCDVKCYKCGKTWEELSFERPLGATYGH